MVYYLKISLSNGLVRLPYEKLKTPEFILDKVKLSLIDMAFSLF